MGGKSASSLLIHGRERKRAVVLSEYTLLGCTVIMCTNIICLQTPPKILNTNYSIHTLGVASFHIESSEFKGPSLKRLVNEKGFLMERAFASRLHRS